MRIAEFLRASFVGALLFSPAMADDIEKVHDEALRVLREQLSQGSTTEVAPQTAKERAEQRNVDRERLQAERRQQFEQFVKERERLHQQQREYEVNAARQAGQIRSDDYNPAHSPALVSLHQTAGQSSAAPMQLAQSDADDVHAQALEVLHQQVQNQSAPTNTPAVKTQSSTTSPSTSAPQPSPDLQRRLKQMQLELEQEEQQKAKARGDAKPATITNVPVQAPATTSVADAYTKELEQRAQSMVEQAPAAMATPSATPAANRAATSSSPGLDAATREMIRRQDQEISGKMAAPPANTAAAKSPSPVATPLPQTLTPEQEAAAIAALRQQEQQSSASAQITTPPKSKPTAESASAKPAAAVKAPVVAQRTETDAADVHYSKELEERARQILLERAQNQQAAATIQAAPAPVAPPAENVAPAPVQPAAPVVAATPAPTPTLAATAAPAPSPAPAPSTDVHSQAQQLIEQINAGSAPKTKMERLKDITDLYRADKMTPAEYHQKRAQILAEPQ